MPGERSLGAGAEDGKRTAGVVGKIPCRVEEDQAGEMSKTAGHFHGGQGKGEWVQKLTHQIRFEE